MKMTKEVGVNNGMPHAAKVCRAPSYSGSFCDICGWRYSYHDSRIPEPQTSVSVDMDDDARIAADVVDVIGSAMDLFDSGDSDGSSSGSSDDSASSNDTDNSGDGGDFSGGGSDSSW